MFEIIKAIHEVSPVYSIDIKRTIHHQARGVGNFAHVEINLATQNIAPRILMHQIKTALEKRNFGVVVRERRLTAVKGKEHYRADLNEEIDARCGYILVVSRRIRPNHPNEHGEISRTQEAILRLRLPGLLKNAK